MAEEKKPAAKGILEGNRKLIVSGVAYAVTMGLGTAMAFNGALQGPEWVELAKWVTVGVAGGYAAGNGLEHIAKRS